MCVSEGLNDPLGERIECALDDSGAFFCCHRFCTFGQFAFTSNCSTHLWQSTWLWCLHFLIRTGHSLEPRGSRWQLPTGPGTDRDSHWLRVGSGTDTLV